MSRPAPRTPPRRPAARPQYSRSALAPSFLAAIVLMASFAIIDTPAWYTWVRYAVAILALIVCVFAVQGKQFWWLAGLVPVAVLWNPVWPLELGDLVTRLLTLVCVAFFIAVGVLLKTELPQEQQRRL